MKSYGQFCGLARALDHVGDRWTLLIVRELLLGDAGYGDLSAALDGIASNLLAERLRQLEADGLVTRHVDPDDRRRTTYRLTPLGRELQPAVLALIEWGSHWMRPGRGDDRFDARWLVLALEALLEDRTTVVRGAVEVRVADHVVGVIGEVGGHDGGRVRVGSATGGEPAAVVEGEAEVVLGLVSGTFDMAEATRRGLRVRGDRRLARALLTP